MMATPRQYVQYHHKSEMINPNPLHLAVRPTRRDMRTAEMEQSAANRAVNPRQLTQEFLKIKKI